MKALDKFRANPRVREVYKDPPDGWWITLKSGWSFDNNEQHTTSELTLRELARWLKRITPCDCQDCQRKDRL